MKFPHNFFFGTATSAYQIEGAWDADGKGPSIWDTYTHKRGKIRSGENGDTACNTYHDLQTDIDIMAELGMNAYRFSVSWPRVLPQGTGSINQKGLDYYSRLVDTLLGKGITPFVTLFHWDLPQAIQNRNGGFVHRDTASYLAEYAEVVIKKLGDRVDHWITVNEPWQQAAMGYLLGELAPGKNNPWATFKVAHNLMLAHGLVLQRIRALDPTAKAGMSLSLQWVSPRTDSKQDEHAAMIADQFMHGMYLDGLYKGQYSQPFWKMIWPIRPRVRPGDMELISAPTDFLGVNYYARIYVRHAWFVPLLQMLPDSPITGIKNMSRMANNIRPWDGKFIHKGCMTHWSILKMNMAIRLFTSQRTAGPSRMSSKMERYTTNCARNTCRIILLWRTKPFRTA